MTIRIEILDETPLIKLPDNLAFAYEAGLLDVGDDLPPKVASKVAELELECAFLRCHNSIGFSGTESLINTFKNKYSNGAIQ